MKESIMTTVEYLNPDGLHKNPAFSQAVTITNANKTVYIGGQNAVDASGNIVGKGDIKVQAKQILKNIETLLDTAGASLKDIIKWNVYVVKGQPPQPAFEVFQPVLQERAHSPLITVLFVAGLAHPDFLMEIDAVAVVS
jgi:enamine deaminase RidA (YjgF/YER057c/UK114 family)